MSFQFNNAKYFCSLDGYELTDLYDPTVDDELLEYPEDFETLPLETKEALKSRRETLVELMQNLNDSKRKMVSEIVAQQASIILVCPRCKKIYDSNNILLHDKDHGDDNAIPFRKPKQHKVVSDDKMSIESETSSDFDHSWFAREIFLPERKKEIKQQKESGTRYKQRANLQNIDNIVHAKNEIKNVINKFGKENVNISINLGD